VFDKKEFVEGLIERGLSRNEILSEAREEIRLTESRSITSVASTDYARFLRALVFFLMSGDIPNIISDDEFQIPLPLAQHLVDRGDFSPDILELFGAGRVTG